MFIREYTTSDLEAITDIHAKSGLPPACMPPVDNPLFLFGKIIERDGKISMASFVKLVSEAFLLIDHEVGTVEIRWHDLKVLAEIMEATAKSRGLDETTVWVPPELIKTFGKRLEELGFIATDFKSYTRCF